MNQATIARHIDNLAKIKAQMARLNEKAELLVTTIKKEGGGESKRWRAELVKIAAHTVTIKAHRQLRLFRKA